MRSLSQIKSDMVDDVLALRSSVRMAQGDSQYDVTVAAPAAEFYRFEVMLELEDRTRNLNGFISVINDEAFKTQVATVLGSKQDGSAYTVDDVNDLISDRLDAYVQDWTERLSGNKATGVVRVYLSDASAVSWDSSIVFTSKSGENYVPTTVVTSVTPNFDSDGGLYYVDIPITASVSGSSANASANAITVMDPSPSSFSYCRNLAAVDGGSQNETDLDLINRVESLKVRNTNGSLGSYEALAEAEAYVDDALATDTEDADSDVYLGSVCDVFTQFSSEDSVMHEDIVYWPGIASNADSESFDFVLSRQPILTSITPIVFRYTLAGVEQQIVPNSTTTAADYAEISYVSDSGTYSGSTQANDKIRLSMKHNTDTYQRKLKVVYVYDQSSEKLQNVFESSDNKLVGPQPLVRKAVNVPLRVIVEITVSFGYTQSDVEASIESNLQTFFNGGTTGYGYQFSRKEIGESVQHSDIASVILQTEGVASYDGDTFFVINTLTGDTSDPTTINSNQYTSLHDVVFTYSTFALSNFSASFSE